MSGKPYMQFYPSDWRGEPRLRVCSLAARGLWIDLLMYMHEGDPRGYLIIEGTRVNEGDIPSLIGRDKAEVNPALAELEQRGVFSRTEDGIIFSRRMVRDEEKSKKNKEWGALGGNPSLKPKLNGGVNPRLKPQSPESRIKKDGADAPLTADAELFTRGKEVLGDRAGGLVAKLKKHHGGNVALTRSTIELAATKQNPAEYIGAVLRGAASSQMQSLADIIGYAPGQS